MKNIPREYWLIIGTYIIVQFSGYVGYPIVQSLFPNLDAYGVTSVWSIFSFSIMLFVSLYLLRHEFRNRRTKEGAELWLRRSYAENRMQDTVYTKRPATVGEIILWAILGFFLAFAGNIIAGLIEIYILGIKPGSENTQVIMKVTKSFPLFMLLPIFFAPIIEEIIFRQIIFRSLYRRFGFILAGILSAFVFAIVHNDFTHILAYMTMGFVFSFVYIQTKRIIVPILVHMALNSYTVIIQFNLKPEDIENMQKQLEQMQTILIGG